MVINNGVRFQNPVSAWYLFCITDSNTGSIIIPNQIILQIKIISASVYNRYASVAKDSGAF